MIALYSSREGRTYARAEFVLAQGVADRAAFAIHNARLYQDSQQATRLRDEVLGVVSHDLRNPVSAILLAAPAAPRGARGGGNGTFETEEGGAHPEVG